MNHQLREDGMQKHNKLFTVSVATQPHCQLRPPPLLMTLHVSEVKNRQNTQVKTMKVFSAKECEPISDSLPASV